MSGDIFEQAVEHAELERAMIGNCDVVFSATLSRQLDMRAGLPLRLAAQVSKRMGQFSQQFSLWTRWGRRVRAPIGVSVFRCFGVSVFRWGGVSVGRWGGVL